MQTDKLKIVVGSTINIFIEHGCQLYKSHATQLTRNIPYSILDFQFQPPGLHGRSELYME